MGKTFDQFLIKDTPAGVMLVGYDKVMMIEVQMDAELLRGQRGADGESVTVQYSSNGSVWHTSFADDDIYMRMRVGSQPFSDAIPIGAAVVEQKNIPLVEKIDVEQVLLISSEGLSRISIAKLRESLAIESSIKQEIGMDGKQDEQNNVYTAMEQFVLSTTSLYINGVRQYRDADYLEGKDGLTITLLNYYPKPTDRLFLEAILEK